MLTFKISDIIKEIRTKIQISFFLLSWCHIFITILKINQKIILHEIISHDAKNSFLTGTVIRIKAEYLTILEQYFLCQKYISMYQNSLFLWSLYLVCLTSKLSKERYLQ